MATVRERSPVAWEVRALTDRDPRGRPTPVSRSVRGTKRDANQGVAAGLTVRRSSDAAKVTTGELVDLWTDQNEPTWAVSTAQNQKSRVAQIQNRPIAKSRTERRRAC